MSLFKKNSFSLPKTVQQSIPYTKVYENGMIETRPGTFTEAYRLHDLNFLTAPHEDQLAIFQGYGNFLNSFSPTASFQIVIFSHMASKAEVFSDIKFSFQRDGLNKLRTEMNNVLLDRLSEGKSNLRHDKFLITSIKSTDVKEAARKLSAVGKEVSRSMRKLFKDTEIEKESLIDRLQVLHAIYNQDRQSVFFNDVDESGERFFNLDKIYKYGITSKDAIGPSGMEFQSGYFKIGNTYGRTLFLERVPSWLSTEFISDISSISTNMLISINFQPLDTSKTVKMIKNRLSDIDGQIAESQKRASQSGYSADLVSPELDRSKKQTANLLDDVLSRDQKLFDVTLTVTVFAPSKKQLESVTEMVSGVATNYLAPLKTLLFQQEDGFNASLPLCCNSLHIKRLCTTETASVFIPFTSQELHQKNGVYYGNNQTTNNLILYSRVSGRNHNAIFFGESGSGKSMMAKNEMISVLLRNPDARVYVIDPENEYSGIANALDGDVLDISAASKVHINPLDMDLDYGGDGDPISMKADYIISMVEIMLGAGRTLDAKAKSVVDRCVDLVYRGYLQHIDATRKKNPDITCDKDAMPTLLNLYQCLMEQPEEEAHTIANVIEIYAKGSLSAFARRSNVETNSRFTVYNIMNLGTGMKSLGLHVCLNDIWNKMIENRKKNLWTYIYIDEFYLLLQSESVAKFLMEVWKRARKWNGAPTGIMQNTEDLLSSATSRNIINNTSFVIMMSLNKIDRSNLADLFQISDTQLEFITNSSPGHGLIYAGKTTLPFNNEYPRDSELYKIMSSSATKDSLE